MRVLLINPSWGARVQRQRFNRRWPPLDLLNVAARLRSHGLEVAFRDARATSISPHQIGPCVQWADRIIITTSPLDRWQCPNIDIEPLLRWTSAIPREKLILYGAHGTVFPESLLKETGARLLIRGEPEDSALALCLALNGKRDTLDRVPSLSYMAGDHVRHNPAGTPVDLAALPHPAYDLTRPEHYEYELLGKRLAVLETSRGCPHRCSYCFKSMYGPGVRLKSLNQVGAELDRIVRIGYRYIYFMDLEFSLNRSRTVELCRLIKEFGIHWCCQTRVDSVDPDLLIEMSGAGCRLVHYGIESGDQQVLNTVHKTTRIGRIEDAVRWTRSAGMATAGFFLFGLPGETPSTRAETEALARRLNVTYASFHMVTVYPETELAPPPGESTPCWERDRSRSSPQIFLTRIYLRYALRPAYWRELLTRGTCRLSAVRLFFQFLKGISS